MRRCLWSILLAVCSTVVVYAAEQPTGIPLSLTAPEAVQVALEQNAALRVRAAEVEAAREQAKSLGKPPPIDFSLSLSSIIEELEWVVSKLFGFIGERKYASKAARAEHAALVAGNAEFVLELTAATKAAYWSLALAGRAIEVAHTKVQQSEQVRDATQALFDAGAGMHLDVARAEVELLAAQQELSSARTTRQAANATLALLLGERPDRCLIATEQMTRTQLPPLSGSALQQIALTKRPALTRLQALVQAAQQGVKLTRAQRVPQIALGATKGGGIRYGFLELSFPLIDLGSIRHSVRSAQWTEKAIRAELEVIRQEICAEVEQALVRLREADQRLATITTERMPQRADIVARIYRGYEQKALTLLDLLDAQRQLNDLRSEETSAWDDYYTAAAGLERAVGVPLTNLEGEHNEGLDKKSQ